MQERLNTEPAPYDGEGDDNNSNFSEGMVEREGETRQTNLILPEADDDAFFGPM